MRQKPYCRKCSGWNTLSLFLWPASQAILILCMWRQDLFHCIKLRSSRIWEDLMKVILLRTKKLPIEYSNIITKYGNVLMVMFIRPHRGSLNHFIISEDAGILEV